MIKYIFSGKEFTEHEIELIRNIIANNKNLTRRKISQIVCESLNWRQPNGRLKDRACRVALLKMNKKNIIELPPPRIKWQRKNISPTKEYKEKFKIEKTPIIGTITDSDKINFEIVNNTKKERFWNFLVDRFHYLGYKPPIGHSLKYLIYLNERIIGCISFANAIYHLDLRDDWIGWTPQQRQKKLHLVINNTRFLILPWIRVRNLGSKILSLILKQIGKDWYSYYKYIPVLVETFVDAQKYQGTVYKAGNWVLLGKTKGKGRCGSRYFVHNHPKYLYVFPLVKNFRKYLNE